MPIIIKKNPGDSDQSLLSKFKRATMDDPGLEQVKVREMEGYQKPSALKNIKNRLWAKERRRIRRGVKRSRGVKKL
jgi:hypothetical protein